MTAVVLLAVSLISQPFSSAQEEKVKLGLLMINADAGIFLAIERGYFREQGVSVEPIYFSSSAGPQMAALTTGELDAGSGRDRKSTRLNSSHIQKSRMPSSA